MLRKTFLCLALVPFLYGCGDGGDVPTNLPQTSVSRQSLDFEFVATMPKRDFAQGESVPVTLTVTNKSASVRQLVFGNASTGQYVVTQGATEIARGQRAGGAVVTEVTLQPSEQYSIELAWNQRRQLNGGANGASVSSGRYTMRANMPAEVDGVIYPEAQLSTNPLEFFIEE